MVWRLLLIFLPLLLILTVSDVAASQETIEDRSDHEIICYVDDQYDNEITLTEQELNQLTSQDQYGQYGDFASCIGEVSSAAKLSAESSIAASRAVNKNARVESIETVEQDSEPVMSSLSSAAADYATSAKSSSGERDDASFDIGSSEPVQLTSLPYTSGVPFASVVSGILFLVIGGYLAFSIIKLGR